jgi:hypothetical protein
MNSAEQLIKDLTKNSGRNSFTTEETLQFVRIAILESSILNLTNVEPVPKVLSEKIREFKNQYALKDDEWTK